MIDVNGLKLTNDAFGHETGDRLLKKVAGIMKKECRNDDIVARLGGDEFSVILPKTDAVQAKLIMDRITGSADKENLKSIVISVAAGYATKTSPDQNIDEIIKIAENNMYSDKINTGKRMRRKTFELITVNLFEKYSYEQDQTERMKKLAARIGSAMGLSKDQISTLETISYYHDIGKIIIPPRLLNRPSDLSLEEYDLVQRHVEAGYQIMKSQEEYSSIAIYVLSHHERWDGNGYPRKQKGHEIPLLSRILAVLDAYTAMTGNLPYKKSLSTDSAIMELKKNAGLQFDPEVVDIFTGILLEEEI
jgi:diguanylate cyclase (GGDEF)-like protein